jgi:hypothetical protein
LIQQAFYDKRPTFSRTGFSLHQQSPAPAGIDVHCDKQGQARNVSAVTFLAACEGNTVRLFMNNALRQASPPVIRKRTCQPAAAIGRQANVV